MDLAKEIKHYINHARITARTSSDKDYYQSPEWNKAMQALLPLLQMAEHPYSFKLKDIAEFTRMRQQSLRNILVKEGNISRESSEARLKMILTKASTL